MKFKEYLKEQSMTPSKAKKIIKNELEKLNLSYTKLSAKKTGFSDLARGEAIVVTIHGFKSNPKFNDLKKTAKENGIIIDPIVC